MRPEGQVSLVPGFLKKSNKYQRTWLRIDTKIGRELLYYAKEKPKTRLQSNRILAILCYKVDMGNIYLSDLTCDLTCSDKPLNIRDGTKALFFKILLLSDEKFNFFIYINKRYNNCKVINDSRLTASVQSRSQF